VADVATAAVGGPFVRSVVAWTKRRPSLKDVTPLPMLDAACALAFTLAETRPAAVVPNASPPAACEHAAKGIAEVVRLPPVTGEHDVKGIAEVVRLPPCDNEVPVD